MDDDRMRAGRDAWEGSVRERFVGKDAWEGGGWRRRATARGSGCARW